jgi:glycine/D-amino acid oxidase-like deaminating enzyme/nitrite reductase/ring-hydroxylating ferredoxin subunit
VLEARRVGHGVTGCTTAKVAALQSTLLSKIRASHGPEAAAVYAEASLAAVEQVASLVADEGIDCRLERRPACTYAADEPERRSVEQEADAAREAGLGVVLSEDPGLPYPVATAVVLEDQLQFHPLRYVQGLAAAVDGDGSAVFEDSRVVAVSDGSPCQVRTALARVSAERVVDAGHYPLLDRGAYFARLKPQRSYCIAAKVKDSLPQTMAISAGSPKRSVRSYADLLVVGGEGHATGAGEATPERYERLEAFAREHWEVESFRHNWSAQDPAPYDNLPMIGRYTPLSSRLYVATGFMKWGLTSGTFAAMILSDLLGGRDNPWASRFTPNRLSLRSTPQVAELGVKFGFDFVSDRVKPAQAGSAEDVPPGEARVVRARLGKTGVYRDEEGALHAVSLRCSHLGCLLRFNSAERSWDCPCHGSRFDVDGEVLEGPAVNPLERRYL